MGLFGAGRAHVGLDVGTNAVRAAAIKGGERAPVVSKFGQVLLPKGAVRVGEIEDPEVVGQAIATLWERVRFGSRSVRVGVANRRVIVRQIEMPSMPRQDLEGAIRFEAQDYIPIPLDEAVMDFEVVDEYSGTDGDMPKMRVVVVAAERQMVDRLLRSLDIAKLEPVALELNAYPLIRGLGSAGAVAAEAEAIVDVGAGITNVVVHQGGKIRFVRILTSGGDDLTQALVSSMQLDWEEAEALKHRTSDALVGGAGEEDEPTGDEAPEHVGATWGSHGRHEDSGADVDRAAGILGPRIDRLVEEIRGSLEYYNAQPDATPLRAVVLTGGGSLIGGLRNRLMAAARSDVEPGRIFSKVNVGKVEMSAEQIQGAEPFLGVAVGLALGAVD